MSIPLYSGLTTAQILGKTVPTAMIDASGNWISSVTSISLSGGSVTTPATTIANTIPVWSGINGTGLLNTPATIDSSGNISGTSLILSGALTTNSINNNGGKLVINDDGQGILISGNGITVNSNIMPNASGSNSIGTMLIPFNNIYANSVGANNVTVAQNITISPGSIIGPSVPTQGSLGSSASPIGTIFNISQSGVNCFVQNLHPTTVTIVNTTGGIMPSNSGANYIGLATNPFASGNFVSMNVGTFNSSIVPTTSGTLALGTANNPFASMRATDVYSNIENTAQLNVSAGILPTVSNTVNLGSDNLKFGNVYSQNLILFDSNGGTWSLQVSTSGVVTAVSGTY